MKGRPVEELVYEQMFPKPRAADPQNFQGLLQRHLVLEVRQEVHAFYGHLETQEAKYPGLDYCHRTHRIRLSRWQWHRRLFRAFDALRLTPAEIASLTKWEGTKWAKERYERENGVTIRDTTADGFPDWVEPEDRVTTRGLGDRESTQEVEDRGESADDMMDDGDDSDEEELQSVGVALNERLRERVALRNATGDTSVPLDEEWEQWLKNAIETGELPHVADQIARFSGGHSPLTPDDIFPQRMLAAARAGAWHEVPDFLHDMIRQSLEGEQRARERAASGSASVVATPVSQLPTSVVRRMVPPSFHAVPGGSGWRRRTYSDLRLPVGDSGTGNSSAPRSAQAPGT